MLLRYMSVLLFKSTRLDVRVDLKSQRHDGSLGSSSSTRGKFGQDVAFSEDKRSVEFAIDMKGAETLAEKSSLKHGSKQISDSNPDLRVNDILNVKSYSSSGAKGKEMVNAELMNNCIGQKRGLHSQDEIKQMDMQFCNDEKQKVLRLAAFEKETRSHSPGAEIKDNKRLAVICDFYAKGWCIKGSSCRFLHVKDLKNDLAQREGDGAADYKAEVQLGGSRGTAQRSRSPSFHDGLAPSVGNNSAFPLHLPSERIKPLEHVESKGSLKFPEMPKFLSQREEVFPLSFKDIGRDSKSQNTPANDYSDHGFLINRDGPVLRNSFHPENAVSSSGHVISSANYRLMNPSSHSRSMEELASIQSQRRHNNQTSPLTSHSPNSSSSTSLLTNGLLSSDRNSAWTESTLPFSYSSLNPSPLGSRLSSLFQISSQFSSSEPDNLPSTKRKFSSDDWEPSVPFRPSFLVRSMMSSTGCQYDPLRDSVELPKSGDMSLRASLHSQGSSVVNTLHQQNHGDAVSETPDPVCNDDTKSVSSHNTFHGNMVDESCRKQGRDTQTTEVEVVGTSTGWQNGTMPKQKNSLVSSDVKDIKEATSDGRRQSQRHGPKGSLDVKADRIRQNNDVVVGHIVEGVVHKESKALLHFRAALIDFVKELLKPKWREGLLSKDAHKQIVKKAVEKVLSTLQPEQIPPSMELVKHYLASSRPKIDKLVEDYAEIYGKL
ncbi:Zinc finger, CCCH-type [Parasponia andersonii]|uniref:Zinc finger, CCCH-type n=1 Tax=Parasponia andersonii TaxID=3476 RepID=A0A2P5AMT5_PARAD|nr:Zinc finger, CCCH-type [Parasponia andersonii]